MPTAMGPTYSQPAALTVACLLLPVVAGCGPQSSTGVPTEFIDSAGVAVVESAGFPEDGAGGWSLDPTPILSIGTLDGETCYQFFGVTGGVKLSDGRLAISDLGAHEVRIYDPAGTFAKSFGREGEGPGEFRHIKVMGTVGVDTLVVLDGRQRRVSRLHPEVGFLGLSTLPEEAGVAMHSNGMFRDGSIVFGGGVNFGGEEEDLEGYQRLPNPYYSVDLEGSGLTHFGEFPGTEVVWSKGMYGGRETLAATFLHFGLSPKAFARGSRLVLGTRDRYEINIFHRSGKLARIVKLLISPVEVTEAHLDALLEERIAGLPSPDMEPAYRSSFRDTPHSETLPAFENLFFDSEGYLWVEDKNLPGDAAKTWTVFDEEGVPLTRLSLPGAIRVLDIGEDFLLARFDDDLGVEYVREYRLTRGD